MATPKQRRSIATVFAGNPRQDHSRQSPPDQTPEPPHWQVRGLQEFSAEQIEAIRQKVIAWQARPKLPLTTEAWMQHLAEREE